MFSEMKCLKTTNQHTETLFFSFETTLKNTAYCVHHPWGLYLIEEQDGLRTCLMPDSMLAGTASSDCGKMRSDKKEKDTNRNFPQIYPMVEADCSIPPVPCQQY